MLRVNDRITIPDDELEVSFARSGGPGGQNVNKVSSKALLRWRFAESTLLAPGARARFVSRYGNKIGVDGSVLVTSDRHRDQAQNLADCHDKLRDMILDVLTPPKLRIPTKRTKGSKERRLKEKARSSTTKQHRRRVSDHD